MTAGSKDGAAEGTGAGRLHDRPAALLPLFAPLRGLAGVGPQLERRIARLLDRVDPLVLDLVAHLPSGFRDMTPADELGPLDEGSSRTVELAIVEHVPSPDPKRPWRAIGTGRVGLVELVFFHPSRAMIEQRFPVGSTVLANGRLQRFGDRWQIAHPDLVRPDAGPTQPVYPSSDGLHQGTIRNLVGRALAKLPAIAEWHDPALVRAAGWPGHAEALRALHAGLDQKARDRLAMDELLAGQLGLAIARRARERVPGRSTRGDGSLVERLLASLPFRPTEAQRRAVAEIRADMAADGAMLRLLQGDVGSGKTLVALLAMLTALEAGRQAALMAPTEVLAMQHAASLARMLAPLGLEPLLLTSRVKGKERARLLERVTEGEPLILVGTHALLQEQAVFADLALAVVDEQHRFGVRQRLTLRSKGATVDLLLMTATPIPRTAAMASYGDIETSVLAELPPGRQPIRTVAIPVERMAEVVDAVRRRVAAGERVYWICPLIEPSERSEQAAAETRHAALAAALGDDRVGLVHGRLKDAAKDAAMARFAAGATPVLVATTVVEVGVDVPEATTIVIEGAEGFGLAQLHQLRGRVGRGSLASHCILLWRGPLSATAKSRLQALRSTTDGFAIADADLKLRGPGEILGDRQSGLPALRYADLQQHRDLVPLAVAQARAALADDPRLSGPRGEALRALLHLFRRTDVLALLEGG